MLSQHDTNADELWLYFQNVITWVRENFSNYRSEMKYIQWGELYNEFKDKKINYDKLEEEISALMQDESVTKKSGIYPYVLTRQEKYLNIRSFSDKMKREAFERQKGICSKCSKKLEFKDIEADHIKPWHEGGKSYARIWCMGKIN